MEVPAALAGMEIESVTSLNLGWHRKLSMRSFVRPVHNSGAHLQPPAPASREAQGLLLPSCVGHMSRPGGQQQALRLRF